jgi:hypothetical protein
MSATHAPCDIPLLHWSMRLLGASDKSHHAMFYEINIDNPK